MFRIILVFESLGDWVPLPWLSWLPIIALSGAYYDYSNWYGQDQSEFHFVKLAVIWFITEESLRWEYQLYYKALNCSALLCTTPERSLGIQFLSHLVS